MDCKVGIRTSIVSVMKVELVLKFTDRPRLELASCAALLYNAIQRVVGSWSMLEVYIEAPLEFK